LHVRPAMPIAPLQQVNTFFFSFISPACHCPAYITIICSACTAQRGKNN
jgi:hypothetical protein